MSVTFDPYVEWLGIREESRPPNHYRLLGLDPLESDRRVIANSADRQMAYLRTFQLGEHAKESQRILAEIAAAKVCLLNPQRKQAYDDQLKTSGALLGRAKPKAKPAAANKPADEATSGGISIATDSSGSSVSARATSNRNGGRKQSQWLIIGGIAGMLVLFAVGAMAIRGGGQNPEIAGNPSANDPGPDSPPAGDPRDKTGEDDTDGNFPPVTSGPPAWETAPTPNERNAIDNFNRGRERTMTQSVVDALEAARLAWKQRDLARAGESLAAAKQVARTPDDHAEVARLEVLNGLLTEFWGEVSARGQTIFPGDKLAFQDKLAAVTANSNAVLRLSSAGQSEDFKLDPGTIRANIAVAVVAFGPDDANDLARIAAFWALDRAGDPSRAQYAANLAREEGLQVRTQPIFDELAYKLELVTIEEPAPTVAEAGGPTVEPTDGDSGKLPTSGKAAIPIAASQQAATTKMQEMFAAQFAIANTSIGANQLAVALVSRAPRQDDPALQYVMLYQAQKLSIASGKIDTFLAAVDAMAELFEIDKVRYRAAGVFRVGEKLTTDDERKQFFELVNPMVDELLELDRYREADVLVDQLNDIARSVRTIDVEDRRAIGRKRGEVRKAKASYEKYQQAVKQLASNPDDPIANQEVGSYLALRKGDWEKGLPHLMKSPNAEIKTAATIDKLSPDTSAEQKSLGDLWWEVATSRAIEGEYELPTKRRGAEWYEKALPELEGEAKETAEKRIAIAAGGRASDAESGNCRDVEIVIDNHESTQTKVVGTWVSNRDGLKFGPDLAHDNQQNKGSSSFSFVPTIPATGSYEVALWWKGHEDYSDAVPVEVTHAKGVARGVVNQRINGGRWNVVGVFRFDKGRPAVVTIFNANTQGYVTADAVRFRCVSGR